MKKSKLTKNELYIPLNFQQLARK